MPIMPKEKEDVGRANIVFDPEFMTKAAEGQCDCGKSDEEESMEEREETNL